MISVSFDGCAGWLHGAPGGRGVIIVPAHGFEDLCSRHAMRRLADGLADAGAPTLRFDLHGCGDSAGSDLDPDRVSTWIGNVTAAIDWMVGATGVQEVALVGIRLGALIALRAACERPVARLALLAPPASGGSYLREMSVLAQVLAPSPAATAPVDGLEIAGFRFTSATLADIKGLDPLASDTRPAPEILLMAPETGRGAARLAPHLEALGCVVRQETFQGYQQMMADPTAAIVPSASLDRIGEWLAAGAPSARREPPAPAALPLRHRIWSEEGVVVGRAARSAGILCRPARPSAQPRAVIFLNAGGIPHIGWARMYVGLARRLAAAGIMSLRLDLPGIGDGAGWTGPGRQTFYDPGTTREVRAAIDLLAAEGASHVTLAGGCSGAHHAFHAALADPRVDGLVLLNLLCFVWGPQYAIPLNAWRISRPHEIESRKRAADRDGGGAGTVLQRMIDGLLPRLKVAARGAFEGVKTISGPLRRLVTSRRRAANEVEAAFRSLSGRGVRVRLVYSEDDPGRAELERYMGPDGRRATELAGIDLRLLSDADHALTPEAARAAFSDLVIDLVAPPKSATPANRQAAAPVRFAAA